MQVISDRITITELQIMSEKMFERLVKAVIDIEREIMTVDAALHADQESHMLEMGSKQTHLWGINLHPSKFGTEHFVEFDSMINMRPSWGNRTRSVDDPKIQEKIKMIVNKLVVNG